MNNTIVTQEEIEVFEDMFQWKYVKTMDNGSMVFFVDVDD
jgi:hypothetical protein